jgi:inward rectifier potassium channel
VFAKASRPTSSILFSEPAVITMKDNKRTLMFRVGNARGNDIVEASVRVAALVDVVSPEGHRFRALRDLELQRSSTPTFVLTWTIFHTIDEDSCLFGVDSDNIEDKLVSLIVAMTGHDSTYAQTVHARHTYTPEELLFEHRFEDVMSRTEEGQLVIDYSKFHNVYAEEAEVEAKAPPASAADGDNGDNGQSDAADADGDADDDDDDAGQAALPSVGDEEEDRSEPAAD